MLIAGHNKKKEKQKKTVPACGMEETGDIRGSLGAHSDDCAGRASGAVVPVDGGWTLK